MRDFIVVLGILAAPFIAVFLGAIALYISRIISPLIKPAWLRKILFFKIRNDHG